MGPQGGVSVFAVSHGAACIADKHGAHAWPRGDVEGLVMEASSRLTSET